MFKKSETVMYPRHGAGKIIALYNFIIDGNEKKYLKIKFTESPVTVSIPESSAVELGLRKPLSREDLKKKLMKLGDIIEIDSEALKTLDEIAHELLLTGKTEDAIQLVNMLRSLARKKEKENKNFSYSKSERLEVAVEFLRSEIQLVLGRRAVVKYQLS